MTCRDEVLAAFERLAERHGREEFAPVEIIAEMRLAGSRYRDSTIRTHVVSRMCANAPDNHPVVSDDLERVARGMYRLKACACMIARRTM